MSETGSIPSVSMKYPKWSPAVLLGLILALALGLRLWNLGKASLWYDEALSVHIASLPRQDIPIEVKALEQIPPLYHYLLHFWVERIGTSEFRVRLPSTLFGLGAILVIYHLGRSLFGPWEGLIAALLLAVSGFNIYYSQEARPYTLLLFAGLLSCHAFVQLLREGGWRNQIGFIIATAFLLWCHLHSVFVVLVQQLIWLIVWWQSRRQNDLMIGYDRWINLNTAALLLFFPWIATVLVWARKVSASFWIPKMTGGFVPWLYSVYVGNWILLVLVILLGIWALLRARPKWPTLFVVLLALIPVLVPAILSLFVRPLLVPRYAIMATGGLALLAARGIMALPNARMRWLSLGACVVLSVLAIPRVFVNLDPKSDARGAAAYLRSHATPDDIIILNAGYNALVFRYYAQDTALGDIRTYNSSQYIPKRQQVPDAKRMWVWTENSPYSNSVAHPLSEIERHGWRTVENIPFTGRLSIQLLIPDAP